MATLDALTHRLRATGAHLLVSALIAGIAAVFVFWLWYPGAFLTIAGGARLFFVLMSVDVISGPALTFVVASPGKPRREFARDLAVIAVLQLAALSYGLYTMAVARPVAVVFEVDLFRVVTAIEVDVPSLSQAPLGLRELSWTGPKMIAAVKPTDPAEQLRTIELGFNQIQLAMLPMYWRDFASSSAAAWQKARPLTKLTGHYPASLAEARKLASSSGQSVENLRFLPLISRQVSWSVIVAGPNARIVGYLPFDAFF